MEHFKDLLLANNCHFDHLKEELEILSIFKIFQNMFQNLPQKNASELFFTLVMIWETITCYKF